MQPKNVEDGLRFLLERAGKQADAVRGRRGRTAGQDRKILGEGTDEQSALINRYARNVMPRGEGLGRKNRLRIAPLRDPKNSALPLAAEDPQGGRVADQTTRADALLMQQAVALTILTYAPLRIGNLARLPSRAQFALVRPDRRARFCSTLTVPPSRTTRRFLSLCRPSAPTLSGSTCTSTTHA